MRKWITVSATLLAFSLGLAGGAALAEPAGAFKFADQVKLIVLRDVGGTEDEHLEAAFSGVPKDRWMVFERASALPTRL